LIEEGLLPFAEKSRAARARAAHVAGRRNAAAIEKGFGRSGDVQKSLLAEKLGPDGLVAFETIAMERIVPTRLRVDIFAFLRVAAVIGLLEGPAVWNSVVDVGHGRKCVRRNIFDVGGIGIEAMTKLAIGAERWLRFGRKSGTEFGETREAGARLGSRGSDQRNFEGEDFVRLKSEIGKKEKRELFGFDAQLIVTRR